MKQKLATLGQRIKARRELLGITQLRLAGDTRVTLQHISAIEQDKRLPSLALLINIADRLGVTIDHLLLGREKGITDIISALEAEERLDPEIKRPLINLIMGLLQSKKSQ